MDNMNLPPNHRLIEHNSIDSTNLEAKRLIADGKIGQGAVVITAKSQTSGRGRLDRKWVSAEGNLFVSVVVKGQGKREKGEETLSLQRSPISHLPFLTALAIGDTIKKLTKTKPLYKWPNDVLVDGKKISGVLIETIANHIVIGVGINVASYPPEGTKLPATCINNYTGKLVEVRKVLELFVNNLDRRLNADMVHILDEWTASAYGVNKNATIQRGEKEISGIFRGIDVNGQLILEMEGSRREMFSFGDVVFR